MSIHLNPRYDPNWETDHDTHMREVTYWMAQSETAQAKQDYEAYNKALSRAEAARTLVYRSFTKQHRTIAEYAEWLFRTFSVHGYVADVPMAHTLPDFSALTSIEEADAAWSHARKQITAATNERLYSLPTGQPDGLEPFSDPSRILVLTRRFQIVDDNPIQLRLFIDQNREDGNHICFAPMSGVVSGLSITNTVEHLATAIYWEACENAGETPTRHQPGWRAWFSRHKQPSLAVDPARFHFYQYEPVADGGFPEQFMRVRLTFDRDILRFIDPQWHRYPVVPLIFKDAAYYAAQLVAPHSRPAIAATA